MCEPHAESEVLVRVRCMQFSKAENITGHDTAEVVASIESPWLRSQIGDLTFQFEGFKFEV